MAMEREYWPNVATSAFAGAGPAVPPTSLLAPPAPIMTGVAPPNWPTAPAYNMPPPPAPAQRSPSPVVAPRPQPLGPAASMSTWHHLVSELNQGQPFSAAAPPMTAPPLTPAAWQSAVSHLGAEAPTTVPRMPVSPTAFRNTPISLPAPDIGMTSPWGPVMAPSPDITGGLPRTPNANPAMPGSTDLIPWWDPMRMIGNRVPGVFPWGDVGRPGVGGAPAFRPPMPGSFPAIAPPSLAGGLPAIAPEMLPMLVP